VKSNFKYANKRAYRTGTVSRTESAIDCGRKLRRHFRCKVEFLCCANRRPRSACAANGMEGVAENPPCELCHATRLWHQRGCGAGASPANRERGWIGIRNCEDGQGGGVERALQDH